MVRVLCLLSLAVVVAACCAHAQETDPFMGNWEGKFKKGEVVTAQILAMGRDQYKAIIAVSPTDKVSITGELKNGKVAFSGEQDLAGKKASIKLAVDKDSAKGKISGKGAFTLQHVFVKLPTMGAQPPAGAVVLFDGKNFDAWQPTKWALADGAMEVRKSANLVSKQEFGDQKIHLEFRSPLMASDRGQKRGNSGVYVQGRYEIQVLDSFGLPIRDNECGGIYKKATPKANACLPPTEWQTYDITFHAPKFDDAGKKTANATISVAQNGILIHDNATLDGATPGGVSLEEAKAGPLLLQDHNGDKVQYRNIWILPIK